GEFHHAAELDFTPPAAGHRRMKRTGKIARFRTELMLRLGETADLCGERFVSSGSGILEIGDLRIHLLERLADRRDQAVDRLLPLLEIPTRRLLHLPEDAASEIEERLVVVPQGFRGKRLEG